MDFRHVISIVRITHQNIFSISRQKSRLESVSVTFFTTVNHSDIRKVKIFYNLNRFVTRTIVRHDNFSINIVVSDTIQRFLNAQADGGFFVQTRNNNS